MSERKNSDFDLIVFDWNGTLSDMVSALDFAAPTQLYPDVKETLQALSNKGYHLAIATMLSQPGLAQESDHHGIAGFFTTTRAAGQCNSKPSPDMLNEIIDFCGVEASQTLMVGDTSSDYQMAKNAGVKIALVNAGDLTAKADYPLATLSDLLTFL